ncbi:unnamed protein product [Callosobruchus maculatus]|uniref:THAP9-like helix-turn-helix domain-containing protein n=1 Tax=Callosobruchus maculatus TaxID=64391 RepID=A0A653DG02_CALMS|nr:unnamed protein product [Callosobruchus maculatus]
MGRNVQYSPELRKFALTLNFCSPKAYNYVRDVFDTCLPHSKTIAKWFQNVDAEPGFTKESINTLRNKVQSSDRPIIDEYDELITGDSITCEETQIIDTPDGPVQLVKVRIPNENGEEEEAWVKIVPE